MNYGPIAQAVEQIIVCINAKNQNKTRDREKQLSRNVSEAWKELFRAQDDLIEEVKIGRIG